MRVTKKQFAKIIKEECRRALREFNWSFQRDKDEEGGEYPSAQDVENRTLVAAEEMEEIFEAISFLEKEQAETGVDNSIDIKKLKAIMAQMEAEFDRGSPDNDAGSKELQNMISSLDTAVQEVFPAGVWVWAFDQWD